MTLEKELLRILADVTDLVDEQTAFLVTTEGGIVPLSPENGKWFDIPEIANHIDAEYVTPLNMFGTINRAFNSYRLTREDMDFFGDLTNYTAWVDDDGFARQKPLNPTLSGLTQYESPLVGAAIVMPNEMNPP